MDQQRLNALLHKWTRIEDIQLLATVFFVETNGDARKLQAKHDKEDSIYGQIASNILGENDALHRFLLFNIWSSNKGTIRECFASVARENGKRKRIRTTPYMGKEKTEETLCWCQFSTEASIAQGLETITCSMCKERFHTLCAGVTHDDHDLADSFVCIQCKNTPKVPNLFREANRKLGKMKGKELFPVTTCDVKPTENVEETSPGKSQDGYADQHHTESLTSSPLIENPFSGNNSNTKNNRSSPLRDADDNQSVYSLPSFLADSRSSSWSDVSNHSLLDVTPELPSPKKEETTTPQKEKKSTKKKNVAKTNKSKDKNSSEESKQEIDVSKIPSSWKISFKRKEWKKVVKKNKETGNFETTSDYGDNLQTPFSETNPVCVLKMNKKIIVQDDESKSFFTAYCLCIGDHCEAHYVFRLASIPQRDEEILVDVIHTSGRIRHFHGEQNKRFLKGKKRQEAKELLKHDLASNVLRKIYATADLTKITKGNFDDVKNLHIFQVAKNEVAKEGDLHPHVIVDLLLTKLKLDETYERTKISGFIQSISLFPFITIMYTEESFQLLKKLTARQSIHVFMDATSSIVTALPKPFDSRKIFYYAVVVQSSMNKPVPILEFYTAQQDALAILYCLESFFYRYKRIYDIKSFNYKINRLEIDFSLASLYAATRVFAGQDIDQYMDSFWETVLGKKEDLGFVIHICRIHVIRFLKFKLMELYRGKGFDTERKTLMKLMYRFVSSKRMSQMSGALEEILTLACTKNVTYETDSILKALEDNISGRSNHDWKKYVPDANIKTSAFYLRCPFGGFINKLADHLEAIDDAGTNLHGSAEVNTYYNPKLAEYIRLHIAPCSPLMTKIPFILANLPIEDDNNNTVENFMKITKNDILQKQRYQRITRVIRKQADNSIGSVREALSLFHSDVNENPFQASKKHETKKPAEKQKTKLEKKGKLISPSKSQDSFKTERGPRLDPNRLLLEDMELIPWGGRSGSTNFSNTCSFDCVMQALYYFYTYTPYGKQFIDHRIRETKQASEDYAEVPMKTILTYLSKQKYNKAKMVWVTELLGKTLEAGDLDLHEEERFYGLSPLKGWFPLKQITKCPNSECKKHKGKIKIRDSTHLSPRNQLDFLELLKNGKNDECNKCNHPASHTSYEPLETHSYDLFAYSQIGYQRTFSENPSFDKNNPASSKYYVSSQGPTSTEDDMEDIVDMFGHKFQVVCYSMYNGRHYVLIIIQGKHRYLYDGLRAAEGLMDWKNIPQNERNSYGITTVWMKRIAD